MWHVLFHCLGFTASCCHSVLGFISDCSLSWRSMTSEQNKLSVSTRPTPGQTFVNTNVEGRRYLYWQVKKSWINCHSLLCWLILEVLEKLPINILLTIGYQIIWHHRLILNSKIPCSFASYKEGSIWASVPGSNFLMMIPRALESANTNPEADQTVPHNPLLKAGYRERRGGGEDLMKVWTGWRRDTPAPWRSLRQLIFSLTVIVPVKITAKIHSQSGTG